MAPTNLPPPWAPRPAPATNPVLRTTPPPATPTATPSLQLLPHRKRTKPCPPSPLLKCHRRPRRSNNHRQPSLSPRPPRPHRLKRQSLGLHLLRHHKLNSNFRPRTRNRPPPRLPSRSTQHLNPRLHPRRRGPKHKLPHQTRRHPRLHLRRPLDLPQRQVQRIARHEVVVGCSPAHTV